MAPSVARRAADFAGLALTSEAEGLLETFAAWLVEEAIPAGGLGPQEAPVVYRRHVADSLTFAVGWRGRPSPRTLLDLGSGVGLPGIVLAIACPDGLTNVTLYQGDFDALDLRAEAVVARAVKAPTALLPVLRRVTLPAGVAVVGGSHRRAPSVPGYQTVTVPASVLDQPAWLLMMAPP